MSPLVPVTILQKLDSWIASLPEAQRNTALHRKGLKDLYDKILTLGELDPRVLLSLRQNKHAQNLREVGIDMEIMWVSMAKHVVDPTCDWLPNQRTRDDVIELLSPYYINLGGSGFRRVFFPRTSDISRFFGRDHGIMRPEFSTLVEFIRFLVDDTKAGHARLTWTARTLFYIESMWEVFGRGNVPFPQWTGDEEFNDWFCQRVPRERVDHIASRLNSVLADEHAFIAPRLLAWNAGDQPSMKKLCLFLRAIPLAFPEWLPEDFRHAQQTQEVEEAKERPAIDQSVNGQPAVEPSAMERCSPKAPVSEPSELARLALHVGHALTQFAQTAGINKQTVGSSQIFQESRFQREASSFSPCPVFSLDEVDETTILIQELTRRLCLMNKMSPEDTQACLHRLESAIADLVAQLPCAQMNQDSAPEKAATRALGRLKQLETMRE